MCPAVRYCESTRLANVRRKPHRASRMSTVAQALTTLAEWMTISRRNVRSTENGSSISIAFPTNVQHSNVEQEMVLTDSRKRLVL